MSYHLTLVKMASTEKSTNSECWRECRKKGNTPTLLVGMQLGANTIENSMHVCMVSCFTCVQLLVALWTVAHQAPLQRGSPGKNTRVGCHAFLQGIFPTQGLNPGLSHCKQILYHLSHQESPSVWEWVAIPSPGDLPNPGIELGSPVLQADSLPAELPGKLREMQI